ncbi:hypothetical protein [Candidatus Accumulibacter vicinus]|uniref:Uncharacterized protein n=1 Tax=Candidatus Accumulibacter vicinus TaxID=2954382 RepID=A0A084Y0T0_9PROT|nr:hypothetical protein [Candidatus Accumulibacter vicinus]KFB68324.1 MAG: hypothetical protein CAPSK01_002178 [Candidatus Accumulibacter vicinus]
MNPDDLIAAVKEAFGQYPEDVLGPIKMADEGFGWLREIFISIQREVEGENFALRVAKLAAAGAYIAVDLENYCGSEHESMLQRLQEVGGSSVRSKGA